MNDFDGHDIRETGPASATHDALRCRKCNPATTDPPKPDVEACRWILSANKWLCETHDSGAAAVCEKSTAALLDALASERAARSTFAEWYREATDRALEAEALLESERAARRDEVDGLRDAWAIDIKDLAEALMRAQKAEGELSEARAARVAAEKERDDERCDRLALADERNGLLGRLAAIEARAEGLAHAVCPHCGRAK